MKNNNEALNNNKEINNYILNNDILNNDILNDDENLNNNEDLDSHNDTLEFNGVNFEKILTTLTILNKHNSFKNLKLDSINDVVDICYLIQIIKLNNLKLTIHISNSEICIEGKIDAYQLYLYNCNLTKVNNIITIINTKYIEFNEIYINESDVNNKNNAILLELINVEEFVYINLKHNNLQTKYIHTIEVNHCQNYMIYNKNKFPLHISFPNGGYILKTEEKICRNTKK